MFKPVAAAARSKAYVCGRLPAEIAGSNPTGGMDVCLLWVLCVVRGWSLVQRSPTDSDASLCVILKPKEWEDPGPRRAAEPQYIYIYIHTHTHTHRVNEKDGRDLKPL